MTIELKKNPKVSWKNSKLKQKTQNSREKLKVRDSLASFLCPIDVKTKNLDCVPFCDNTCWEGGGVCESLGEGELCRLEAPLLLSEAVAAAVTAAVAAVRLAPAAPVIPMAIISCWAYPASEVINWLMISWYCLGSRLMLDLAI